jgi:hypothetical protein
MGRGPRSPKGNTIDVNPEVRNRIRLAVAAYAYEYEATSIMSDHEFDAMSREINTEVDTGNAKLDNYFKKHFEPATGLWVRQHPDKQGLRTAYERYHNRGGHWYVGG